MSSTVGDHLVHEGYPLVPRFGDVVTLSLEDRHVVPNQALRVDVGRDPVVLAVVLAEANQIRAEGGFEFLESEAEILKGDRIARFCLLDYRAGLRVQRDVGRVAAVHANLDLLLKALGALVEGVGSRRAIEILVDD
jgi:hypothetical protein